MYLPSLSDAELVTHADALARLAALAAETL